MSAYLDVQNVYNRWYPEFWIYSADWSARERAIGLFYADCETDVAREAASRLCPNVVYGPTPPADPPIWQATASTYLWCDDDATVLADYQHRLARVCRFSEGFASSHSPMLSQPERMAEAIGRVLERTPPSAT